MKHFKIAIFKIGIFKIAVIILSMFISISYADMFEPSDDEPVDIRADTARIKWEIEKIILEYTNKIRPIITQGDSTLKANTIIYDEESSTGYAYEKVYYENKKDGIVLRAGEGTYYTKDKKIVLTKGPRLYMKKDKTRASSWKMIFYRDKDYVIMIGNVKIKGKNFTMTGDKARMHQKSGKFKIIGNAKTVDKDTVLTADIIDIKTENNELQSYTARDNVVVENKKDNYFMKSGNFVYYEDLGYSRITDKPRIEFKDKDIVAYSKVMEKFDKEEKANLLGDVVIVQGDRRAYAKWGVFYIKEQIMVLTGAPVLVDGKSKFKAAKIEVDVEAGVMRMIGGGQATFEYEN